MDKVRLVLNKINNYIERQEVITNSDMKGLWNDLSNAITENETKPVNDLWQQADQKKKDCDHDYQSVFHFDKHICDYCPECDSIRTF